MGFLEFIGLRTQKDPELPADLQRRLQQRFTAMESACWKVLPRAPKEPNMKIRTHLDDLSKSFDRLMRLQPNDVKTREQLLRVFEDLEDFSFFHRKDIAHMELYKSSECSLFKATLEEAMRLFGYTMVTPTRVDILKKNIHVDMLGQIPDPLRRHQDEVAVRARGLMLKGNVVAMPLVYTYSTHAL